MWSYNYTATFRWRNYSNVWFVVSFGMILNTRFNWFGHVTLHYLENVLWIKICLTMVVTIESRCCILFISKVANSSIAFEPLNIYSNFLKHWLHFLAVTNLDSYGARVLFFLNHILHECEWIMHKKRRNIMTLNNCCCNTENHAV